jgi:hypothetical protein
VNRVLKQVTKIVGCVQVTTGFLLSFVTLSLTPLHPSHIAAAITSLLLLAHSSPLLLGRHPEARPSISSCVHLCEGTTHEIFMPNMPTVYETFVNNVSKLSQYLGLCKCWAYPPKRGGD